MNLSPFGKCRVQYGICGAILIFMTLQVQGKEALIKPDGAYGIGYQEMDIINSKLCPDKFYRPGVNEDDFSKDNTSHCHIVQLRVYYPSNEKVSLGDTYDKTALANDWIEKQYHLNQNEKKRLFRNSRGMHTFSSSELRIAA